MKSDLLKEINNRETQGGTSLGNGVAIPHARLKSLDKIVVAMARLKVGVDFDEGDREPVRLIFIVITPIDQAGEYLKVLAKLSKFLREKKLLKTTGCKRIPFPSSGNCSSPLNARILKRPDEPVFPCLLV